MGDALSREPRVRGRRFEHVEPVVAYCAVTASARVAEQLSAAPSPCTQLGATAGNAHPCTAANTPAGPSDPRTPGRTRRTVASTVASASPRCTREHAPGSPPATPPLQQPSCYGSPTTGDSGAKTFAPPDPRAVISLPDLASCPGSVETAWVRNLSFSRENWAGGTATPFSDGDTPRHASRSRLAELHERQSVRALWVACLPPRADALV
jgi:hypothetical protein